MTRSLFFIAILVLVEFSCNTNYESPATNSDIEMVLDTTKYSFRNCNAVLEKNNLKLSFQVTADSVGEYTIEVNKFNGKFVTEIYQTYATTDSSYVSSRFTILKQHFEIDKLNPHNGDSVSGSLSVLALVREAYLKAPVEDALRQHFDTVRVVGTFQSRVQ